MKKIKWVRTGKMCKYWDGADCPCKIYGTKKPCPVKTDNCFAIRRKK